jgi:hypothetical protein
MVCCEDTAMADEKNSDQQSSCYQTADGANESACQGALSEYVGQKLCATASLGTSGNGECAALMVCCEDTAMAAEKNSDQQSSCYQTADGANESACQGALAEYTAEGLCATANLGTSSSGACAALTVCCEGKVMGESGNSDAQSQCYQTADGADDPACQGALAEFTAEGLCGTAKK